MGTPAFDAVNQVISFPDLDYSVETRNILLRLANWLGHDELRDYLRGRLRFEVRTATTRAREQLLAGMNRTIGGIRIAGTIENLTPLGLTADPQRGQFRAFVNAAGTLDLALQ